MLVLAYLDEKNVGARFGEPYGDGLANAPSATGDNGGVSFKGE